MESTGEISECDSKWSATITAVHQTPIGAVLAMTGGGASAISRLLEVPGGSATILEAIVPYAEASLVQWLGRAPDHFCVRDTALQMAATAHRRAHQLLAASASTSQNVSDDSSGLPQRQAVGVGCTASLASARPKKGDHRVHVAIQTDEFTSHATLILEKGARTRREEEILAANLILHLLAQAAGIDASPALAITERDQVEQGSELAPEIVSRLVRRETGLVWRTPQGKFVSESDFDEERPVGILCGSFNPLHTGHRHLREVAQKKLGGPVAYEISLANVDKPPLDFVTLAERCRQFDDAPLALTVAPTYDGKSRVLQNRTFVVGVDTALRIVDAKYYGNDVRRMEESLRAIASAGCRFLVAGRVSAGRFETLDDVAIPSEFQSLFSAISADEFRVDCSSTELRRSQQ